MDVDGRRVDVRMGKDGPLVTDEGHYILDLHLGRIGDAAGARRRARTRSPAWSSTGSSSAWRSCVVLGRADGSAEVLLRPARGTERRATSPS